MSDMMVRPELRETYGDILRGLNSSDAGVDPTGTSGLYLYANAGRVVARDNRTHGAPAPEIEREIDVQGLKDASGLSWQQIAEVAGVTRRAVHYWASGGQVAEVNKIRLRSLQDATQGAGSDIPAEVRRFLMTPDAEGRTPLDRLASAARPGFVIGPSVADRLNPA